MERNALVYAGHTVWNRSAERTDGGYAGGEKWRPREEWVIQKETHEALISEDEAELILAAIAERKRSWGEASPTRLPTRRPADGSRRLAVEWRWRRLSAA